MVAVVNAHSYAVDVTEAEPPTPSDQIAARLKELRRREGLTTKALAKSCAAFGAPQLTPAALMNIESGRPDSNGRRRRNITIDELLVLALALTVPPSALLLPEDRAATYAVTPNVTGSVESVFAWLTGQRPVPVDHETGPGYLRDDLERRYRAAQPAWMYEYVDARLGDLIDKKLRDLGLNPETSKEESGHE